VCLCACAAVVPPRIDQSLVSDANLSVIIDRSIAIDCPVTGVPQPDIVWTKDGQQLVTNQNDDIRVVSRGQRLEVNNADLSDAGRYICVAKNAAGFVERDFQLDVWGMSNFVIFVILTITHEFFIVVVDKNIFATSSKIFVNN